ncbi:MAG: response regulator [Fusicatenibacter sp.]|nr:response regulator [Fusicatenibacter sp.]
MYNILIADDETMERDLIRFLLTRDFPDSFRLLEAANGQDALAIIRQEKIHILLTDVQMPFLSGTELASIARKTEPDMEILFFSGFDDFEYVQNALVLRAVNYILKPVNPEQFRQIIGDILNRLNSKEITFAKSKSYYSDSFFDNLVPSGQPQMESLSEQILLEQIALAISLKNAEQLTSLTEELLKLCSDSTAHTPVWVRHTCVSLLQLLMKAIPSVSENDFEKAAEKIYGLRYFTDIREVIQKYLHLLVGNLHQEVDGANYAVYQIKQYIEEHYDEDLTLNLLADQVYLSPNYVSAMFTKVTGCSLHRYLKQFRMKKACDLLIGSNMKIADISRSVGYPTPSYFIKTFQEMYGVTPSNYRAGRLSQRETKEKSTEDSR